MIAGEQWTWWDSGTLSGRRNCMLDSRDHSECAGSGQLRFHRFAPSVIVGAHEDPERVVRLGYCKQRGIDVVRRLTGGGALYLDSGQLCWSLTMPSVTGRAVGKTLQAMLERLTRAVVDALCSLGVGATFEPFNDIEINGRKIACSFLTDDGWRMLFQGSLLLDVDIETMLKALRVPTEKLSALGICSARKRFTTLREQLGKIPPLNELESRIARALGKALGVGFQPVSYGSPASPVLPACPDVVSQVLPKDAFRAFHRTAGGVLHAAVVLSGDSAVIADVHLS
ncbi:MAG: lipoate--protein ligase family protein, partial [Acidiferrobacterales bacterium]